MSDVVSRLLAAIDEREREARSIPDRPSPFEGHAPGECDECDLNRRRTSNSLDHVYERDEVLRLCQAHRDIVAEWQEAQTVADGLSTTLPDSVRQAAHRLVGRLFRCVLALALAARVVTEHPHPHAERLRIAVVEAGDRRWRVVYGGTRRLTVGDVVPVATPGTRLTAVSGLRLPPLRARNFRGVRSEAMLCSSDELGWTVGGPDEVLVLDSGHEVGALVRRPSGRCHGPGPEDLAEALIRLSGALATDSRDWGQDSLDAWLWGLLCGWDCEDHLVWPDHVHDEHCADGGAMREVAVRHGWSDDDVARLRRYRAALLASTGAAPQVASIPDPSRGWLARVLDRLFGRTT